MTGMSDMAWQKVKDAGAQVSIAFPIEMNMRHGMPPILKMQSLGMEPSLSTDVECTMTADFFTQMRSAMTMQRMVVNQMILEQGDFRQIPRIPWPTAGRPARRRCSQRATCCATPPSTARSTCGSTTRSARSRRARRPTSSSSTPTAINVAPLNHVPGAVVSLMERTNVETVIVAGKVRKWKGQLLDVDLAQLRRELEDSRDYIFGAAGIPQNLFSSPVKANRLGRDGAASPPARRGAGRPRDCPLTAAARAHRRVVRARYARPPWPWRTDMARAVIGLGANLGDPVGAAARGHRRDRAPAATRASLAASSFYRTAPVGFPRSPISSTPAVTIETELAPRALLDGAAGDRGRGQAASGRSRTRRARSTSTSCCTATALHRRAGLTLPHPRMHERAFVLAPLVEIEPDAVVPGQGRAADRRARALRLEQAGAARTAIIPRTIDPLDSWPRLCPVRYRFIAVEGPIGAGKTTLARRLAERLGGEPLLEDPDANPFLARFYEDMARYALPTQLFFLFQRFEQLARGRAARPLRARARRRFPAREGPALRRPDPRRRRARALPAALRRARPARAPSGPGDLPAGRRRGRSRNASAAARVEYERAIEADYLARLADAYARFFHQYDEAPVLAVNSEHLDFAASERDLGLLLEHLAAMRGRREFFNVGT